jgi:hypothetical protein
VACTAAGRVGAREPAARWRGGGQGLAGGGKAHKRRPRSSLLAPRWSKGLPADAHAKGEDFYDDPKCVRMYMDFVADVVNRKNTYNGIVYRWAAATGGD